MQEYKHPQKISSNTSSFTSSSSSSASSQTASTSISQLKADEELARELAITKSMKQQPEVKQSSISSSSSSSSQTASTSSSMTSMSTAVKKPLDDQSFAALFSVFHMLIYPELLPLLRAEALNRLASHTGTRIIYRSEAEREKPEFKSDKTPAPPSSPANVLKLDELMKQLLLQHAKTQDLNEAYIKKNAEQLMKEACKLVEKEIKEIISYDARIAALLPIFKRVIYPQLLSDSTLQALLEAESLNKLAFEPLSHTGTRIIYRSEAEREKQPEFNSDNTPAPPSSPAKVLQKLDELMKQLLLQHAKTQDLDEAYIKENKVQLMKEAGKLVEKEIMSDAIKALQDQKAFRDLLAREHAPRVKAWISEQIHDGMRWPQAHEPYHAQKKLELAGFEFCPIVFKPDNTKCRVCKAEYHGYREWVDLRAQHKKECPWNSRR